MKKRLIALIMCLAIVLSFCSCGKSGASDTGASSAPAGQSSTTTSNEASPDEAVVIENMGITTTYASLRYYTIVIADPVIRADGEKGRITYTSVLNADAYGARGTYHMKGTHYYELRDGSWIAVNK